MEKTTEELMKILESTKEIGPFLSESADELPSYSLSEYLNLLIEGKGLKKSDIIRRSSMEKTYFYQILKGRKNPTRNKLLMIAFGMELDIDETRRLLKIGDCGDLYPKNERDCVIIHSILNGKTLVDANIILDELSFEIIE